MITQKAHILITIDADLYQKLKDKNCRFSVIAENAFIEWLNAEKTDIEKQQDIDAAKQDVDVAQQNVITDEIEYLALKLYKYRNSPYMQQIAIKISELSSDKIELAKKRALELDAETPPSNLSNVKIDKSNNDNE